MRLFWLAMAVTLATAPRTRAEEPPVLPAEVFFRAESVFRASFSPDGRRILATSDRTGVPNAYAFPVDGSEPAPLTHSTSAATVSLTYFPEDERFLFLRDGNGDERAHLYVRELDGTERDLTPGKNVKALFLGWTQDKKTFFAATNERDARYFDVYEFAADGYRRSLFYRNDGGYAIGAGSQEGIAISGNRRYVALMKIESATDRDVYLVDRTETRTRLLTPYREAVANEPVAFDREGSILYLLTDREHEYSYVVRQAMATFKREVVEKGPWDVEGIYLSRTGRYGAFAVNRNERMSLRLYEADRKAYAALPELPYGEPSSVFFTADDRGVALYGEDDRGPADLFFAKLDGDEAPRRLTRSLPEELPLERLVKPEVVRFRARDGLSIPGILYKPRGASPTRKAPALIFVHGGPGGQAQLGYDALLQFLADRGYVVFAINPRGSGGYGKTFLGLDDGRHGDADLDDCVDAKKMLADTGWVDAERIGILGTSYGGFVAYAALAFRPEVFRLGIGICGVSDWVRTLKELPPWWEPQRKALYAEIGDPATQGDYLRKISPLVHADRIARPVLAIHGANDPRVNKAQSEALVDAVKANGIPARCLIFPDEGHGIARRENRIRVAEEIQRFLEQHLAPAP